MHIIISTTTVALHDTYIDRNRIVSYHIIVHQKEIGRLLRAEHRPVESDQHTEQQ